MSVDNVRYLPEEQLVHQALEALMAALGPVETTRFLALTREDRLESVARHRQWQASLDPNTFLEQVFGNPR
jgi:hypothetical protein